MKIGKAIIHEAEEGGFGPEVPRAIAGLPGHAGGYL